MEKSGKTGKCLIQAWLITGFAAGVFLSIMCVTADVPAVCFLMFMIAMMAVWPFGGSVPLPYMELMIPEEIPYRLKVLFFGVFLLSFCIFLRKNKKVEEILKHLKDFRRLYK